MKQAPQPGANFHRGVRMGLGNRVDGSELRRFVVTRFIFGAGGDAHVGDDEADFGVRRKINEASQLTVPRSVPAASIFGEPSRGDISMIERPPAIGGQSNHPVITFLEEAQVFAQLALSAGQGLQ